MNDFQVVDRTYSPWLVNVGGTMLMILILIIVLVPFSLFWGQNPLFDVGWPFGWWIIGFFASIIIHELLHGLGYALGGAGWGNVKFGVIWKYITPYAHCKVPLPAQAYTVAVALPGIVLGGIPVIVGWLLGNADLTLYGAIMLSAAAGDLMVLASLVRVPRDAFVQDHPSRPGFQILIPNP